MLTQDVQAYLAVRRAMGFGMKCQAICCEGWRDLVRRVGRGLYIPADAQMHRRRNSPFQRAWSVNAISRQLSRHRAYACRQCVRSGTNEAGGAGNAATTAATSRNYIASVSIGILDKGPNRICTAGPRGALSQARVRNGYRSGGAPIQGTRTPGCGERSHGRWRRAEISNGCELVCTARRGSCRCGTNGYGLGGTSRRCAAGEGDCSQG
jgi:hypothetical protein